MFVGNAKHQIDEKGRIRIPTKFRDELGVNPFIMKGPNGCLCIYPEVTAKTKFLEKFSNVDISDSEGMRTMRQMFCTATFMEEDKQGRMTIPKDLALYAQLEKDLVTIGTIDHVEIWSEKNFEEYMKDSSFEKSMEYLKGRR